MPDVENSLNAALALTGAGFWSWDFEGGFELNVRTRELLGISVDQPVQSVEDFLLLVQEAGHRPLLDAFEAIQLDRVEIFDQTVVLDEGPGHVGHPLRFRASRLIENDRPFLAGVCEPVEFADSEPLAACAGFERFLDLSSDLFAESTMDGYLQNLNPAWERTLGYSCDELMARPFLDFVHPDDVAMTRKLLVHLRDDSPGQGEPDIGGSGGFENRYRCKDGSYRWLSWTWALELDHQRVIGVARDVTADRAHAEQLSVTLAQLKDSNGQLQNFASVASHDMREPLRMISSYLTLLQERYPDVLDEKGSRYIKYACEGADRMRSLIEDLLTYARLGTQNRDFKEVALPDVLEDAVSNLSASIEAYNVEVTVDSPESPVVLGDRIRLTRLFQNMIGNAIKFHDDLRPRQVRISCYNGVRHGEPDCWIVSVRDNGIGIDPDHKDLLFNLFQRLNARDEYEGSGIGLAVCRKIAEQHGGRIWFESNTGEGSTFFVNLRKLPVS